MVPKGNPIPAKGERNIFCPYYDNCLDYAVQDWWNSWNCSQCPYRLIKQSFVEHDYDDGEAELDYDVLCDLSLEIDQNLFE
jgi:hypothetical protein